MLADKGRARRISSGEIDATDRVALARSGLAPTTELGALAHRFARARRRGPPRPLDYLILVPTLRCNLACSYCQVSRAPETGSGFDWDEATLNAVRRLVAGLEARAVKIEFQGGEPTLRPDLLQAVIDAVPEGVEPSFVICSNLQVLDETVLALFDRPDVSISTSLDGPADLHARQRHAIRGVNFSRADTPGTTLVGEQEVSCVVGEEDTAIERSRAQGRSHRSGHRDVILHCPPSETSRRNLASQATFENACVSLLKDLLGSMIGRRGPTHIPAFRDH